MAFVVFAGYKPLFVNVLLGSALCAIIRTKLFAGTGDHRRPNFVSGLIAFTLLALKEAMEASGVFPVGKGAMTDVVGAGMGSYLGVMLLRRFHEPGKSE